MIGNNADFGIKLLRSNKKNQRIKKYRKKSKQGNYYLDANPNKILFQFHLFLDRLLHILEANSWSETRISLPTIWVFQWFEAPEKPLSKQGNYRFSANGNQFLFQLHSIPDRFWVALDANSWHETLIPNNSLICYNVNVIIILQSSNCPRKTFLWDGHPQPHVANESGQTHADAWRICILHFQTIFPEFLSKNSIEGEKEAENNDKSWIRNAKALNGQRENSLLRISNRLDARKTPGARQRRQTRRFGRLRRKFMIYAEEWDLGDLNWVLEGLNWV